MTKVELRRVATSTDEDENSGGGNDRIDTGPLSRKLGARIVLVAAAAAAAAAAARLVYSTGTLLLTRERERV